MYSVTIGREGNQSFRIEASGVSRQHLRIDIPDDINDKWVITDLNSANGTFILKSDGSWVRLVGSVFASPYTVLQLGPANSCGYRFWILQVLQEDPDEFTEQFLSMQRTLEQKRAYIQKCNEERRQAKSDANVGGMLAAMAGAMAGIPAGALIGRGVYSLLSSDSEEESNRPTMEQIREFYSVFLRCPRGTCSRPLSDHDIEFGRCPACKAHI